MEQIARLIEALTPVLWLGLVVYVVVAFSPSVKRIVDSAAFRKFKVVIGGQELTMEEVTEQQTQVLSDLTSRVESLRQQVVPIDEQTKGIHSPIEHAGAGSLPRRSILWVDDNPKNNGFIVQMLRDRGINVDIALTTQEAAPQIGSDRYGAFVSDMGRDEGGEFVPNAGINLLKKVRAKDPQIPFVIYCSARGVRDYGEEALQLGATDVTTSPANLTRNILQGFGMLGG